MALQPRRDLLMTAPITVDATLCPLCGQGNQCAMEVEKATGQPQPPCWCTTTRFEAELLARIPAEQRGQACVCARCAQLASASKPSTQPNTP